MSALATALERLSPRDRALLVVLAGVIVVGGTALAWQITSGKHKARERRLEANRAHLETLYGGRDVYLKRQAKLRERENILRIQPPQLRRYLEGVARNIGVTIDDLKDRPVPTPAKPTDVEEVSMEARLTNVAYDKVVKLLMEVESSQAVALIRELRLDYKGDNNFREVRFTVSTFHLKGGGETPAGAPAEPPGTRGQPPRPGGATGAAPPAAPALGPASTKASPGPSAPSVPTPTVTKAPSLPAPTASPPAPVVSPAGAAAPTPLRIPSLLRRDAIVRPRASEIAPPGLVTPRVEPPFPVKLPAPGPARGKR
ncbi:MAG: hypothetical protein HYY84_18785 [Deltaproteobacteria bacterium]|nr:hypothetical protein [Deltaproteobacteria bacterium]